MNIDDKIEYYLSDEFNEGIFSAAASAIKTIEKEIERLVARENEAQSAAERVRIKNRISDLRDRIAKMREKDKYLKKHPKEGPFGKEMKSMNPIARAATGVVSR